MDTKPQADGTSDRSYRKPEVRDYGDLAELTAGHGHHGPESDPTLPPGHGFPPGHGTPAPHGHPTFSR